MRKKESLLLFFTVAIFVAALVRVRVVSSTMPRLYLDTAIIYANPGESFTVDIMVEDVVNLYSWQVQVNFNPDVVQFVNVTEGDFLVLQAPNGTWTHEPAVGDGWVGLGWGIWGPYVGPSGDGWLGTMEFRANAETRGETILNITDPSTKLIEYIPPPPPPGKDVIWLIPHTTENALFTNEEVPPHAEFTYSPSAPGIGEEITFDASASYANPPNNVTRYEWDFGDGTTEIYMGANLTDTTTHTYAEAGLYNVLLTVVDDAPASDLISSIFNTTMMPRIWYDLYGTYSPPEGLSVYFARDVGVIDIQVSETRVTAGETVYVNVTVKNNGVAEEDFDVSTYYDEIEIKTETVTDLGSGATETLSFPWDTTGVEPNVYTISANATLAGDTNPANNRKVDGTVEILSSGSTFPMELVVAVGVSVVGVGAGAFLYMRRRHTSQV